MNPDRVLQFKGIEDKEEIPPVLQRIKDLNIELTPGEEINNRRFLTEKGALVQFLKKAKEIIGNPSKGPISFNDFDSLFVVLTYSKIRQNQYRPLFEEAFLEMVKRYGVSPQK